MLIMDVIKEKLWQNVIVPSDREVEVGLFAIYLYI
jgi:hypothetical protein